MVKRLCPCSGGSWSSYVDRVGTMEPWESSYGAERVITVLLGSLASQSSLLGKLEVKWETLSLMWLETEEWYLSLSSGPYMCVSTHVCTYIHPHTRVHLHTHTHAPAHTGACMHMHTHMWTCTHRNTHTYTCVLTHRGTHTYTQGIKPGRNEIRSLCWSFQKSFWHWIWTL